MERFPRQHGSRDAQNPPRSTLPSSTNPVYYTDRPSTNLYHTSSSQHRHTTAPACRGSYPRRPHAPLVPQNSLRPTKNQKHVAGQDRSPYGTASSPAAPDRMKRKKKPALCPRPSHLALCLSLEHATAPGLDASMEASRHETAPRRPRHLTTRDRGTLPALVLPKKLESPCCTETCLIAHRSLIRCL